MAKFVESIMLCLTVIALSACGSGADKAQAAQSEMVSGSSSVAANYAFLEKLGIKVTPTLVLPDELKVTDVEEEKLPSVSIDENAQRALLYGLLTDNAEDGETMGITINGVRPLAGEYTLVMFNFEYGDGSHRLFAIYDSEGKRTDVLTFGAAVESIHYDIDESHHATRTQAKTEAEFSGHEAVEIERTVTKENCTARWDEKTEQFVESDHHTEWKVEKTYKYSITSDGRFVPQGTPKVEQEKTPDPEFLLVDNIADMNYRPASDDSRIDALNATAKAVTAAGNEELEFHVLIVAWDFYRSNSAQLLLWVANHRHGDNRVTAMLEQLVSEGFVDKTTLITDIDRLSDANARDYLHSLTAQWGRAGAVG